MLRLDGLSYIEVQLLSETPATASEPLDNFQVGKADLPNLKLAFSTCKSAFSTLQIG
jgi:hypothetical protein